MFLFVIIPFAAEEAGSSLLMIMEGVETIGLSV
jgi:hypothetical protein